MEVYLGTIIAVAFNYAPKGWAICNGATMQITSNQALFTLLGVQFGGDGKTTFNLPDLRGRAMVNFGQYTPTNKDTPVMYAMGLPGAGGSLTAPLLPHTHVGACSGGAVTMNGYLQVSSNPATVSVPGSTMVPASLVAFDNSGSGFTPEVYGYGTPGANTVSLASAVSSGNANISFDVAAAGSPSASNLQPSIGVNYLIATSGLWPSRPS